ncbi:hypothetical protein DITRI_Ditri16bG0053000 [Diplodiscus trichospermus]
MAKIIIFFIPTILVIFFCSSDTIRAFIRERIKLVNITPLLPYKFSLLKLPGKTVFLPFDALRVVIYACIVWKALTRRRKFYYLLLVLYLSYLLTNDRVEKVARSANNKEQNNVGISGYAASAAIILAFTARVFLVPWSLL